MATELTIGGVNTGSTVVAVVRRDSDETVWNGSSFGTWNNTTFANGTYDISLTEQGTSGYFVGNFPTAITTAGDYNVSYYTRTGSSSPYTHSYETTVTISWDGTGLTSNAIVGLNWVTASDYKTLYGVTDSSLDAVLDLLIPMVSAALNTRLDRTIKATDIARVYRGSGLYLLNLREYPVNSITDVTFDYLDTNPLTITGSEFYASTTGILYFKPSSDRKEWFSSQFVHVNFNAGYSTVPYDLQLLCLKVMRNVVLESDPEWLVTVKSYKDVTVKFADIASGNPSIYIGCDDLIRPYEIPLCI